jgi:hypothetical protein
VIDPYNDFIYEGGKIWPRIKAVAEANNCVPHMQQVLNTASDLYVVDLFKIVSEDSANHCKRPGRSLKDGHRDTAQVD